MGDQITTSEVTEDIQGYTVDEVLSRAGVSGIVQAVVHINVFLLLLTTGCQVGMVFFTGYSPPWKCGAVMNNGFCNVHRNVTFTVDMEMFNYRCRLNRTEWIYAATQNQHSVVTEFDLVCDKSSTAALMATMYYVGSTIGALFGGPVGDAYGRKPIIVLSLVLTLGTSIALSYSHKIWEICLGQFLRGIGSSGNLYPVLVYLSEISPPKFRSTASNIALLINCLSFLLMDMMAYVLDTWRELSFYFGLIGTLLLLLRG